MEVSCYRVQLVCGICHKRPAVRLAERQQPRLVRLDIYGGNSRDRLGIQPVCVCYMRPCRLYRLARRTSAASDADIQAPRGEPQGVRSTFARSPRFFITIRYDRVRPRRISRHLHSVRQPTPDIPPGVYIYRLFREYPRRDRLDTVLVQDSQTLPHCPYIYRESVIQIRRGRDHGGRSQRAGYLLCGCIGSAHMPREYRYHEPPQLVCHQHSRVAELADDMRCYGAHRYPRRADIYDHIRAFKASCRPLCKSSLRASDQLHLRHDGTYPLPGLHAVVCKCYRTDSQFRQTCGASVAARS